MKRLIRRHIPNWIFNEVFDLGFTAGLETAYEAMSQSPEVCDSCASEAAYAKVGETAP